jgi:hypothetical protein
MAGFSFLQSKKNLMPARAFDPEIVLAELSRARYPYTRILEICKVQGAVGPEPYAAFWQPTRTGKPRQCLGVDKAELDCLIYCGDILQGVDDPVYGKQWFSESRQF